MIIIIANTISQLLGHLTRPTAECTVRNNKYTTPNTEYTPNNTIIIHHTSCHLDHPLYSAHHHQRVHLAHDGRVAGCEGAGKDGQLSNTKPGFIIMMKL